MPRGGERPRRMAAHDLRQFEDVRRSGAAAAADDVHQPAPHVFGDVFGEHRGRFVVAAHDVGQSGVGVDRHAALGRRGQPFEVGEQLFGAERAVEAHGQRPGVGHRDAERLDGLPREGAARGGQRPRDDHGQASAQRVEEPLEGVDRRLGVERVEEGLEHHQVDAPFDQAACLVVVGGLQPGEVQVAFGGRLDLRRERQRVVGRPHRARHEARTLRIAQHPGVGGGAGRAGGGAGDFAGAGLQPVVGQRHGVGVERVGGDDVRPGGEVFFVDLADDAGLRQRQQVVAPFELLRVVAEQLAAVVRLGESVALHHRAESAVQQQDAAFEFFFEYVCVFHASIVRLRRFRTASASSCP